MPSGSPSKSRGLVLVLSSLATTAAVVTLAAALTSSSGDTSASAATTVAHFMLSRAVVPHGSTRTELPTSGPLVGPFSAPATPNLIDVAKAWTVQLPLAQASAFLAQHPPVGMTVEMCCGQSSDASGITSEALSYRLATTNPVIDSAILLVGIAPLSATTSIVRADAEVVWVAARTKDSFVPRGDRFLLVTASFLGRPASPSQTVAISDPAKLATLRARLDGLRAAGLGPHSCPARGTEYRLAFSPSPSAAPDYVATIGYCREVAVNRNGRVLPALRTDATLIQTLEALFPGVIEGRFLAVGGPPDAPPSPQAGTISVHAGDLTGPVVATGRSGPDGLFRIEVPAGGPYALTGRTFQFVVNGDQGRCAALGSFSVQPGQTVTQPVYCQRR